MPQAQHAPLLRQIRASAGSGKTYALTSSFLAFLAQATQDSTASGCGVSAAGTHAWPEILAVTFTNRAAAEMQERIIGRLKDTALGLGSATDEGWTQEQALRWLEVILRRFGSLNVRTIDSLLHLLVRLAALELDLPPDFKPVFSTKEALAPLLDALLEKTRHEPELRALLDAACRDILFHKRTQQGFLAGNLVRDGIINLVPSLIDMGTTPLADTATITQHLNALINDLRQAAQTMQRCLDAEQLTPSAYFRTALEKCCSAPDKAMPPDSTMLYKPDLDACLLKASKGKGSDSAEACYARLRARTDKLATDGALLRSALVNMPFVHLTQELLIRLPQFMKEQGTMPADFVPRLAQRVISGGYGVSEAFCRLGTRLTHILMDEFQDTNREQWEAIHPLVLEALSRGGSLTWVGDVKQAIYGWRHGDASLFGEVLHDAELCAIAPEPQCELLPYNRRSCPAIVHLNNSVFSRLEQTGTARAVLRAMLPNNTPEALLNAVLDASGEDLRQGFAGAEQHLPPSDVETETGYVRLSRIDGDNKEEQQAAVHEALLDTLHDLASRRAWGDIAILVRSNSHAALVAGWLMAEGMPVVTENSFLLADHPLVNQLVALLRFLDAPRNDLAFWTLISGSMLGGLTELSPAALNDWISTVRAGSRRQLPLYRLFQQDFPHIWMRWLAGFHADAGLLSPYDGAHETLERLNVWERFPEDGAFIRRFLEVLQAAESQGLGSVSAFLEHWDTHGQQEKAPMPEALDAVRVMTIHKSKGLQFPVVIIPWNDFTPKASTPVIPSLVDGLPVLVTRTSTSGLAHYQALADTIRESLHLLYVAWTRPEAELHAFLAPQEASGSLSAALDILLDHLHIDDSYTAGTPTLNNTLTTSDKPVNNAPPKAVQEPLTATGSALSPASVSLAMLEQDTPPHYTSEQLEAVQWRPMQWLPRLRIFRNPLQEFAFTQKRRGVFVHHCLECLQQVMDSQATPQDNAQSAMRQALRTFPLPIHDTEALDAVTHMLEWFLTLPDSTHWLRYGTPEQSLLDTDNKLYRADLIVRYPDKHLVVEYKTGDPTPAHTVQAQRYMTLLAEATGQETEGVLVYLDHQHTVALTRSPQTQPPQTPSAPKPPVQTAHDHNQSQPVQPMQQAQHDQAQAQLTPSQPHNTVC